MGNSRKIALRAGHFFMAFCCHFISTIRRGVRCACGIAAAAGRGVCSAVRLSSPLPLHAVAGVLFAAATLAGCGGDGVGALMVDPARYDAYNCKELIGQWNGLVVREKQLRNLINKADESGGGVVIGALAYRGDYQTVLEQKKVMQRAAAEKKCQLVPTPPAFTSDQTIR